MGHCSVEWSLHGQRCVQFQCLQLLPAPNLATVQLINMLIWQVWSSWSLRVVVCVLVARLFTALQVVPSWVHRAVRRGGPANWLCRGKIPVWQHATRMSNDGHHAHLPVSDVVHLLTPLTVVRYQIARETSVSESGRLSFRGECSSESKQQGEKLHGGLSSTWKRRNPAVTVSVQNTKGSTGRIKAGAGRGSGDGRRTGIGKARVSTGGEFHSTKLNVHQIRGELSVEGSDHGSGVHIGDRADFGSQSDGHDLCPLPFGVLSPMLDSGLSWDQVQGAVFAQYGTTLSIPTLKRRLSDERSERVGARRTGKTRRERTKERKRQMADSDSVHVTLRPDEGTTVAALASMLDRDITDIIEYLVRREGSAATARSTLPPDVVCRVCAAFGAQLEWAGIPEGGEQPEEARPDSDSLLVPRRPPIVAVMGHVDHGKTSLLDRLRSSSVAASEAGGITQALSAFQVIRQPHEPHAITFIDTPGHSAFGAMRRRGAAVTDVVVLVVAADDGVMEQTKECIHAARAANCPIVVAINKIDKEGTSVDAVWASLAKEGLLVEELGGDVQCALVSAKTGAGMEDLLDQVQLQAELLDIRADPGQDLAGTVLEVRKDKRLGTVATVIVRTGTLRVGDTVIAGQSWGKVKKLLSCTGTALDLAGPSTPVQVIGLTGSPGAGASVTAVADTELARAVVLARRDLEREEQTDRLSASVHESAAAGLVASSREPHATQRRKFSLVVKADTAGSLEALCSAVTALLCGDQCVVDIIFRGLGDVTSADVTMASTTSDACIVAYNVGCHQDAHQLCRTLGRTIISSPVIYSVLDALSELQRTTGAIKCSDILGRLSVKHVFTIGKGGKVAGCQLSDDGSVSSKGRVRIMRDGAVIHEGDVTSLKSGKHSVEMVTGKGAECGLSVEGFIDFVAGDVLEVLDV